MYRLDDNIELKSYTSKQVLKRSIDIVAGNDFRTSTGPNSLSRFFRSKRCSHMIFVTTFHYTTFFIRYSDKKQVLTHHIAKGFSYGETLSWGSLNAELNHACRCLQLRWWVGQGWGIGQGCHYVSFAILHLPWIKTWYNLDFSQTAKPTPHRLQNRPILAIWGTVNIPFSLQ